MGKSLILVRSPDNLLPCFQCVAENRHGRAFSHPSLVMVQESKHEPRGLDLFKNKDETKVELVDAAKEQNPAEVFVVLPSDRAEQVPGGSIVA